MKKRFTIAVILLSVFIFSCGGGQKVIIPETTKVLDEETLANLSSVSEDRTVLTFERATEQLYNLKAGDVLVIGLTEHTPDGLLRKVVSLQENDDGTFTVQTSSATLTDAIQEGIIELPPTELTIDDVEEQQLSEGVSFLRRRAEVGIGGLSFSINHSVAPNVWLNGGVEVTPAVEMKIRISWFTLKEVLAKASLSENAGLTLIASKSYELNVEKNIAEVKFRPIVVNVGPVPVYIRPVFEVNIGAKGLLSAQVKTGVEQKMSYEIGAQYKDGSFSGINDFNNSFNYTKPSLDGNVNVHPYGEAKLVLYIYGVAGPGGNAEAYFDFNGNINADPWWELYGGLNAGFDLKGEILSYDLVDWETNLIDYRTLLAKGKKPSLTVSPAYNYTSGGNSGTGPFSPSSFQFTLGAVGGTVNWTASTNTPWLSIDTTSGTVDENTTNTVTVSLNNGVYDLSAGQYPGSISFTNATNDEGSTTRNILLNVKQSPSIAVLPGFDSFFEISGDEGGPFSPTQESYTVTAQGGQIDWEASSDVNWLTVDPASGTLQDGESATVNVTVNDSAKLLSAKAHEGAITFTNKTNGQGNTSRTAYLLAKMKVNPATAADFSGMEGGPFSPQDYSYTIEALNGNIDWEAEVSANWMSIDQSSGTAPKGGSSVLKVLINDSANSLSPGTYTGELKIKNSGNSIGDVSVRTITLVVKEIIEVSPATGFSSSGEKGGPFSPASKIYTLSAPGGQISWTASADVNWLTVSPSSGNADPSSPVDITVSLNSNANALAEGTYTGNIVFTGQSSTKSTTVSRTATLTVTPPSFFSCTTGPVDFPPWNGYDWWTDFGYSDLSGQTFCDIGQFTGYDIVEFHIYDDPNDPNDTPSVYAIDALNGGSAEGVTYYFESVTPNAGTQFPYWNDRNLAWLYFDTPTTIVMQKKESSTGNILGRYSGTFIIHSSSNPTSYSLEVQSFQPVQQ